MAEPSILWLIQDMKKMHVDGASNEQLCHRATEIHDRLQADRVLAKGDARKIAIVEAKHKAFEKVVTQIRKGRDDTSRPKEKAMKAYDDYIKNRKKKEGK